MKLAKAFFRLPVQFDAGRLRAEIEALPVSAWAAHPSEIEGNSSLRLVTADGGENDEVYGSMLPTPHLRLCPYLRQVLASFGVVWSRSRLMRLDPHTSVPEHADINYHWFYRVRMHIPIVTHPGVRFHCDGQAVHMAPGEAWIFDNWRLHHVENPTDTTRIHLVADTSGTAAFWEFVAQAGAGQLSTGELPYRPDFDASLLTERIAPRPVMPPAEVDLLLADFRGELALRADTPEARAQLGRYHWLLQGFCFDWRQLYALRGEGAPGRPEFRELVETLRAQSRELGEGLIMRTNRVAAHTVLEGRLLRHLVHDVPSVTVAAAMPSADERLASLPRPRLRKPVFIVAAPRSGSTLLFETLAVTPQFWTVAGEAHWLVESIPELRPGAPGVDSNRLTAANCTEAIARRVEDELLENLRDPEGRALPAGTADVRVLEKTPKNALRIPFFERLFPDARFVFLWRDPRENLSSIIEAWRSGQWTTYRELAGWDGPWSLLLPPGWQPLRGKSLEDVAAHQWDATNRIVLDDLAALQGDRWTALSYAELLADPRATVRRICAFADIDFDAALQARVAGPLPLSRHTQTPPVSDKWRRNEEQVLRVLPVVEATWQRLKSL
jgi:LPS sulfotransferase NodH